MRKLAFVAVTVILAVAIMAGGPETTISSGGSSDTGHVAILGQVFAGSNVGAVPVWFAGQGTNTATATWICVTGSNLWSDTACWSGLFGGDPYPDRGSTTYSVLLPDAGVYTVVVNPPGDAEIMMDGDLQIDGANTSVEIANGVSFVVNDQATIAGQLRVLGGSLTAGPSATVNIDEAGMEVLSGGLLRLPSTSYTDADGGAVRTLRSSGAGSRLDLPDLTNIQGPATDTLTIEAASGGVVDGADLGNLLGNLVLHAHGMGGGARARINFPQVDTLSLGTQLLVRNGGEFIGAPLTNITGLRLEVHSAQSVIDTSQVSTFDDGRMFVDGSAVVSFPGLTTYATGVVDLGPGLRALRSKNPGSELYFPALTSIDAAAGTILGLRAESNGQLFAPALTSMTGQVNVFVENSAGLVEVGMLNLDATSVLTVRLGAELRVLGSMRYAITNPASFIWTPDANPATLNMLGGVPGDCVNLEVGGVDVGTNPQGWVNNFHVDRLLIGPGAHVQLVDEFDNSPGLGDEALYVNTLEFADPTGVLALNGLQIYYATLIGNVSQVRPDCRALAPMPHGAPLSPSGARRP